MIEYDHESGAVTCARDDIDEVGIRVVADLEREVKIDELKREGKSLDALKEPAPQA